MSGDLDWDESESIMGGTGSVLLVAATALYWSMLWLASGFAPIAYSIGRRRLKIH